MELIQGNIRKTEELYRKSLNIANEFNLPALISQSKNELDILERDLEKWEKILHDTSIKERFDLLHLEEYIKEGKQYLTFNSDYENR